MKSQVKLPDLKKLFEEIDANQKEIDKIRENYSGRRSEENQKWIRMAKSQNMRFMNSHSFT